MENAGTPQNPYINAMCDDNGFTQYGMSLRDYFAAKAMQGLTATGEVKKFNKEDLLTDAKCYYAIADAMLEARENETV